MSKVEVGKEFDNFSECEAALGSALGDLRTNGHHPLRVYNSQTATDYNRKRVNAKNPVEPVDSEKFKYTYYSCRCMHYGDATHRSKGLRPNQRCFAMGCPVKITLSYDR